MPRAEQIEMHDTCARLMMRAANSLSETSAFKPTHSESKLKKFIIECRMGAFRFLKQKEEDGGPGTPKSILPYSQLSAVLEIDANHGKANLFMGIWAGMKGQSNNALTYLKKADRARSYEKRSSNGEVSRG